MVVFALALARAEQPPGDTLRVTVRTNADGSRTTYEWDTANRKATATTTDGTKVRERIRYVLDENGRFVSGNVFGANGKLRFRTGYKYDSTGRLTEESQFDENGTLLHRIVHTYDANNREIGYAVYDANGKLQHREGRP